MYELFTTFVRYILVAVGAHVAMTYDIDQSVIEPMIGAGMAGFAIVWMLTTRFGDKIKALFRKNDQNGSA